VDAALPGHFKLSVLRQPESRQFVANPIARRLFAFYFQLFAHHRPSETHFRLVLPQLRCPTTEISVSVVDVE